MTIDPTTATIDECRDWLYRRKALSDLIGTPHTMEWASAHWDTNHCRRIDDLGLHPFPPTLDAAAEAMPSGWFWCVEFYKETFTVRADTLGRIFVVPAFDCDNELLARFRLAVACCQIDDKSRKGQ